MTRSRAISATLAATALAAAAYVALNRMDSEPAPSPEPPAPVASPAPLKSAETSPPPASAPQARPSAAPQAALSPAPPPAPATAADSPLSPGSLAEIRRCLGDDSVRSLDQLLARLTPPPAPGHSATRYRKYRNVHVRLPTGEKRRLHLYSDSTPDGKPVARLRVFTEDAEGLPVPVSIPEAHSSNPDESVIQGYLAGGTTEFIEESFSWQGSTNQGGTVDWTEENGMVRELHWVGGGRSLGCARADIADCECRE